MARRPSAPVAPPASRRALAVALVLSLAGLGVAAWLVRLHVRAHAGFTSACAINATFNCDLVATSPFSVVLGLPVAIWGVLGFATTAGLAGLGLARRRPHPAWASGLLVLAAAGAVLASIALALVSELLIRSFCVVCAGAWTISVLLLLAAWRAARPAGVANAIGADLAVLRRRSGRTLAVLAAGLAGVVVLAAVYPRYWEKAAAGPRAGAPAAPAASGPSSAPATLPAPGPASPGPTVIVEYSDYLCPFCASAHEDVRARIAGRADVKVLHKHFPLDAACNPLVKRSLHPGACELAKAGICGEAQGRGAEMDKLIFANQRAARPVDALARDAGLDAALFRECLASPATDRRLAADIRAGIDAGIRATPTYVVEGVLYSGGLPPQLASAPGAP